VIIDHYTLAVNKQNKMKESPFKVTVIIISVCYIGLCRIERKKKIWVQNCWRLRDWEAWSRTLSAFREVTWSTLN